MQSALLARLHGAQETIAAACGVSPSTISRAKEGLELYCQIVARCGLKLVAEDNVCVPAWEMKGLRQLRRKVEDLAPWLMEESDL